MELEGLVQIIGNVGFPIAITVYLLQNFGKKIESLDTSIRDLSQSIEKITDEKV